MPAPIAIPVTYSRAQAARMLGVTTRTIDLWREAKRLRPVTWLGRRTVRFTAEAIRGAKANGRKRR